MKIIAVLVLFVIFPLVLIMDGGVFFLVAFADAMERIKKEAGRD